MSTLGKSFSQNDKKREIFDFSVFSDSCEVTQKTGELFARFLSAGDIVLLEGDLGAGKTAFTAGIARGFSLENVVSSPTFTIMQEYFIEKKLPLSIKHFDLYRLTCQEDFLELGFDEIISKGESIYVIEWAERLEGLYNDRGITVKLEHCFSERDVIRDVIKDEIKDEIKDVIKDEIKDVIKDEINFELEPYMDSLRRKIGFSLPQNILFGKKLVNSLIDEGISVSVSKGEIDDNSGK